LKALPLALLIVVSAATWALVAGLRQRRRRYLVANRVSVLEECLGRARVKQRDHRRRAGRTGPQSGEDDLA